MDLFVTAWAGYAFSFYLAFGSDVKHCQVCSSNFSGEGAVCNFF